MDWVRESSWARAARRLARNASARSSTSAIRRCSASGGRGIGVFETRRLFTFERAMVAPLSFRLQDMRELHCKPMPKKSRVESPYRRDTKSGSNVPDVATGTDQCNATMFVTSERRQNRENFRIKPYLADFRGLRDRNSFADVDFTKLSCLLSAMERPYPLSDSLPLAPQSQYLPSTTSQTSSTSDVHLRHFSIPSSSFMPC